MDFGMRMCVHPHTLIIRCPPGSFSRSRLEDPVPLAPAGAFPQGGSCPQKRNIPQG